MPSIAHGWRGFGTNPNNQYPQDAPRIEPQWYSSNDQLVHMIMVLDGSIGAR